MEPSEELRCLFTAAVEEAGDGYTIRVPRSEVEAGTVASGEAYRVAIIARDGDRGAPESGEAASAPSAPQPPVEVGEIRYVEIEDLGKQGDGIARVERGYVIIVPGAEVGERVKVEIDRVQSNFAVGEVIEETFD